MKYNRSPYLMRVFALFLIAIFLCASSVSAQNNTEICTKALEKCTVEAVVAGLFGGINSLAAYAAGCLIGYDWCLKYYIPLK